MKKWILLSIIFLFFCSGCYDYREINDLAIVSGIAIDYKEEEFQVVFEILNTKNQENSQEKEKVYYAEGSDTSLAGAFSDTSLEIAKYPYLPHLKTIVIDEEIAKNHIEEIMDFLLRDNYIRNIFYLVVAKDVTAKEIIQTTDVNNPIASTAIAELIDNNSFVNNIGSDLTYEKFIMNLIDPLKDTYISTIYIENNILKLGSLGIFEEYKLKDYLSVDDSATFNALNGTSNEIHLQIPCPDNKENFITLSTYDSPKSEISIEEQNVNLKAELETRIIENHCNLDFKDEKSYIEIEEMASKKVKEDIENLIQALINANSDILKISQIYYQKNKKEIDFTTLDYKADAKVIINRNGLIFEVKNDK